MKSTEINDVMNNSPVNTLDVKIKQKKNKTQNKTSKFQILIYNILHFMKRTTMCCSNRSSDVYPLNQGHMM